MIPNTGLAAIAATLFLIVIVDSQAHVALLQPAARQVVNGVGLIQRSYTTFGGPGDIYGNNANVFGGPSGPDQLRLYGYGLCGDDGRRKAFMIPSAFGYAPTNAQMTVEEGKPFDVLAHFSTHHNGWMEFRLCAPEQGQKVVTKDTVECFKQHVLQLASEQYYNASDMPTGVRSVFDFEGTADAGYTFQHAKCQQGPPNTCCDADSGCSPESNNVHRFMLPRPGVDDNRFWIRLIAPAGVTCDRCTLQMTYRTGNSPDNFPETFWNCADIAIVAAGSNPNKSTAPTRAPSAPTTVRPTVRVSSVTANPTIKSSATPKPTIRSGPTKKPTTPFPTTKAPTQKQTCGATWSQCGGVGFAGAQCCSSSNDVCVEGNDYWSMCTPKSSLSSNGNTKAPSLRPTSSPSIAGCATTWGQCGGQGFNGNACCASISDSCVQENEWWSMCKPT